MSVHRINWGLDYVHKGYNKIDLSGAHSPECKECFSQDLIMIKVQMAPVKLHAGKCVAFCYKVTSRLSPHMSK